jgi:hypothetical protein
MTRSVAHMLRPLDPNEIADFCQLHAPPSSSQWDDRLFPTTRLQRISSSIPICPGWFWLEIIRTARRQSDYSVAGHCADWPNDLIVQSNIVLQLQYGTNFHSETYHLKPALKYPPSSLVCPSLKNRLEIFLISSPRNRLSPRYINIAQDRYSIGSMAGANSTSTPKRKQKKDKRN